MGTQFSPVVEAFLRGQQQQAGLVDQAKNYQLRKEQIEAAIDEAQKRHQLDQEKLELEHQIFQLNFKKAQQEQHDKLVEQLAQDPSQAPGTTNLPGPGINMAIPGMPSVTPNTGAAPGSPAFNISRPDNLQITPGIPINRLNTPQPGTPLVMDSAMGPISLNMPKSLDQVAAERASALLPSDIAKYKATLGASKDQQYENALKLKDIQREYSEAVAQIRAEATKYASDNSLAAAELRGRMGLMNEMFRLGLTNPDGIKDLGVRVGQGTLDMTDIPAQLRRAVDTFMANNNIVKPQGGTKLRADVMDASGSAARLLSDFDDLNKKYPAAQTIGGRTLNRVSGFFNNTTDLGQEFDNYGKNIAAYATITGETPGMMRSPILAQKAAAVSPKPGDTMDIRAQKRRDTIDLALSKINRRISTLSKPQKIEFWRDALNNMPNIKGDATLMPVLEKILQTGEYNPDWLKAK